MKNIPQDIKFNGTATPFVHLSHPHQLYIMQYQTNDRNVDNRNDRVGNTQITMKDDSVHENISNRLNRKHIGNDND